MVMVLVLVLACMAATGTGTLIFTDDGTADGSYTMYPEVYLKKRKALYAQVPGNSSKLLEQSFILQQDNDPKHTAEATPVSQTKKRKILE